MSKGEVSLTSAYVRLAVPTNDDGPQQQRRGGAAAAFDAKSTIALAFSADGALFASTHGDHTVKVFESDLWTCKCVLRGHARTPWSVKFHPSDARILASGSLDQRILVWDVHLATCIAQHEFHAVVSCISFDTTGSLLAVTAGKRIQLWRWRRDERGEGASASSGGAAEQMNVDADGGGGTAGAGDAAEPPSAAAATAAASANADEALILEGDNPYRCVSFRTSASNDLFFVAETNAGEPPRLQDSARAPTPPPFTVQLWMWLLPHGFDFMRGDRVETALASLHVPRSVMYSDAGFDVSRCGRYLSLCELDLSLGYRLRTFSLQPQSLGVALQTFELLNCPYITSVQFSPLSDAVLLGYGRCQRPPAGAQPSDVPHTYAVLRCIAFDAECSDTVGVREPELFEVSSTDESNVALFHPRASCAASLTMIYATKNGQIRAFRFDASGCSPSTPLDSVVEMEAS